MATFILLAQISDGVFFIRGVTLQMYLETPLGSIVSASLGISTVSSIAFSFAVSASEPGVSVGRSSCAPSKGSRGHAQNLAYSNEGHTPPHARWGERMRARPDAPMPQVARARQPQRHVH